MYASTKHRLTNDQKKMVTFFFIKDIIRQLTSRGGILPHMGNYFIVLDERILLSNKKR
jgi:hypothetical protein